MYRVRLRKLVGVRDGLSGRRWLHQGLLSEIWTAVAGASEQSWVVQGRGDRRARRYWIGGEAQHRS